MLACEVLPHTGTLDSLTQSDDLLREIRDVVTSALSLPARSIEVVNASLPSARTNRQMLQTSNVEILIQLSQEEATQPLGTDNAAAVVRIPHSLQLLCAVWGHADPQIHPPPHICRSGSQWSRQASQE